MEPGNVGQYYMTFEQKADYEGTYDNSGIPMLDYHGKVGMQYNPIAIAQYGLGNYNLYKKHGDLERFNKFLSAADWLMNNLEINKKDVYVWNHHFDWEYRDTLRSPWYSALAQGQGISVLLRAYKEKGDGIYLKAANKAFISFLKRTSEGGVSYTDEKGDIWFEEAIVFPPTHTLNGFIWALWGVYDHYLMTGEETSRDIFDRAVVTITKHLPTYDTGYWSLYEHAGKKLQMIASPFYHSLHIVQLDIMYRLTGIKVFREYSDKWAEYKKNPVKYIRALLHKSLFKVIYY